MRRAYSSSDCIEQVSLLLAVVQEMGGIGYTYLMAVTATSFS
jgi:hypothetical protein